MGLEKIVELINKIGNNSIRIKIAQKKGVKIGTNCLLLHVDFGSEPYLISIGNHCAIASGVNFITHDGGTWIFRENKKYLGAKFGPIIIRDNCFIGMNTIILPNVEIGPNSVIGAGSVVTKKIPQDSVYAGNPAHFICTIDDYLVRLKSNTDNLKLNGHESRFQKDKIIDIFSYRFK
jgi:acetyltransferase-like isoleucine patch superfamily enzyme